MTGSWESAEGDHPNLDLRKVNDLLFQIKLALTHLIVPGSVNDLALHARGDDKQNIHGTHLILWATLAVMNYRPLTNTFKLIIVREHFEYDTEGELSFKSEIAPSSAVISSTFLDLRTMSITTTARMRERCAD